MQANLFWAYLGQNIYLYIRPVQLIYCVYSRPFTVSCLIFYNGMQAVPWKHHNHFTVYSKKGLPYTCILIALYFRKLIFRICCCIFNELMVHGFNINIVLLEVFNSQISYFCSLLSQVFFTSLSRSILVFFLGSHLIKCQPYTIDKCFSDYYMGQLLVLVSFQTRTFKEHFDTLKVHCYLN